MILIKVNGSAAKLQDPVTVADYLESQGYQTARIAVELNGAILPKAAYQDTPLAENDVMEVVSFVGGG